MKKRLFNLILCLGMTLLLSGCMFKSAHDLFALPALPEDYNQLQAKLDEVMRELGAEYTAPLSGINTATVQLQDLNNDGIAESTVAFFRVNSPDAPLRIMIFRQRTDGAYEVDYTLSGDGNAIESITYIDLDGDGMKDILVSWQISGKIHALTAFKLSKSNAITLAHLSYNDSYSVFDLDRDNQQELMVIQLDESSPDTNRVEFYDLENNQMVLAATAPISRGAESIATDGIHTGYLRNNIPALYIDFVCGDAFVTDIFAMRDEKFTNISLNALTKVSTETMRFYTDVVTQDINNDGVIEIPKPIQTTEFNSNYSSPFWLINWRQFDLGGNAYTMQYNYHNLTDGWYLNIPEHWISQVVLSRDDFRSAWGERSVIFSLWDGTENEPQEFLRIYRLSGTNRKQLAQQDDRFILYSENSVIYAASFSDIGWNSGLTEDNLVDYFSIIRTQWYNQ